MSYFVYILYSSKCDKYYIGHTQNLERRLEEHNSRRGGAFSSNSIPWDLKHTENFNSRSEAARREREIKKKKSRKYIEFLIDATRASR